jgi:hypothetical protein
VAAQFVTNPVQERLPQIRLERPFALRLEALDPLKRLEQGFLDKVLRVGGVARVAGEASARPAAKGYEVAREQGIERGGVPFPDAREKPEGRVGAAGKSVAADRTVRAPGIHVSCAAMLAELRSALVRISRRGR